MGRDLRRSDSSEPGRAGPSPSGTGSCSTAHTSAAVTLGPSGSKPPRRRRHNRDIPSHAAARAGTRRHRPGDSPCRPVDAHGDPRRVRRLPHRNVDRSGALTMAPTPTPQPFRDGHLHPGASSAHRSPRRLDPRWGTVRGDRFGSRHVHVAGAGGTAAGAPAGSPNDGRCDRLRPRGDSSSGRHLKAPCRECGAVRQAAHDARWLIARVTGMALAHGR
jgi:hypothetical protein